MSHIVLPGCSAPERELFRVNSTLDLFFKEFDELTRSFSLRSILVIVILYLLLNIFHLIILTRPQMKSISVSKEMILIAACGVINGITGVLKNIDEIVEHDYHCAHSWSYHVVVLAYFWQFQIVNQVILWEIVYITFLRATIILDVRHGMKTENLKLAMRIFIGIMFTIFITNHSIRIALHRILEQDEPEEIRKDGKTCTFETAYEIRSIAGDCLRRVFLSIAAVISVIIPILIMFILSIFLVFELQPSSSEVSSTHRQTTAARALLLFLCFYVLAQLPYVLLFTLGLYNPADFEQLDEYIYTQVDIFIYVNMCLGILVYCLMSSQYRETIRATFWKKKSGEPSSRSTP